MHLFSNKVSRITQRSPRFGSLSQGAKKKILLWGYIRPIDVGVNIRQWQALYSHLMSQTAVSLTKKITFKTYLKHRMDFFESFSDIYIPQILQKRSTVIIFCVK